MSSATGWCYGARWSYPLHVLVFPVTAHLAGVRVISASQVVPVTGLVNYREPPVPAFLFDLDGTLIDSVYPNVIAWRNALATADNRLVVVGRRDSLATFLLLLRLAWCRPGTRRSAGRAA